MYNLFSQFGVVYYNGVPVRNILTRIDFSDIVKKTGGVYHPYIVEDGERPDVIAYNYYGDSRYSWLVYMSNNIMDPYYEWPMTQHEFNRFITKKYGSREAALKKILYWKDNWETDDRIIDVATYNSYATFIKKYWSPVLGYNSSIVSYTRTPTTNTIETNKLLEITISPTISINGANYTVTDNLVSDNFSVGDLVGQYDTNGTLTASGEVTVIYDDYKFNVKHIQGDFIYYSPPTTSVFANELFTWISTTPVTTGTTTTYQVVFRNDGTNNTSIEVGDKVTVTGITPTTFNTTAIITADSYNEATNFWTLTLTYTINPGTFVSLNNAYVIQLIKRRSTIYNLSDKSKSVYPTVVRSIGNIFFDFPVNDYGYTDDVNSLTLQYFSPVFAYDYESDLNTQKRSIRLIDRAYVDQIERELSEIV
jgi:hypothetical protein